MCFNSDRFGAPSVRATLDPVAGFKDMRAIIEDKPRDRPNQVTKWLKPEIPEPPPVPPPPQSPKSPDTAPLKRRNTGGGIAVPQGSTMLSGPSGIATSQLALGSQTLLGGG